MSVCGCGGALVVVLTHLVLQLLWLVVTVSIFDWLCRCTCHVGKNCLAPFDTPLFSASRVAIKTNKCPPRYGRL